jgi:NAD-dependent dihydropyrimidine dehydrogenase PreA subunit
MTAWCRASGEGSKYSIWAPGPERWRSEQLVDHRKVILPQLAATGIEAAKVKERSGWQVVWEPVYARDIPAYLRAGWQKTLAMRQVEFPWKQRLEMAVAWAFPISVIPGIIMVSFWPGTVAMLVSLVWGLSLLIFACFPVYSHRLSSKGKRVGLIFFDFGCGGLQLVLWGIAMVGLAIYSILTGDQGWAFFLRWAFISLVLVLIVSLDLMGSTPVYKSGLHEDRWLEISLDEAKCRGVGFCEQVCPRNCYEMDLARPKVTLPGPDRCVQCGACVVQCPFDAFFSEVQKVT